MRACCGAKAADRARVRVHEIDRSTSVWPATAIHTLQTMMLLLVLPALVPVSLCLLQQLCGRADWEAAGRKARHGCPSTLATSSLLCPTMACGTWCMGVRCGSISVGRPCPGHPIDAPVRAGTLWSQTWGWLATHRRISEECTFTVVESLQHNAVICGSPLRL